MEEGDRGRTEEMSDDGGGRGKARQCFKVGTKIIAVSCRQDKMRKVDMCHFLTWLKYLPCNGQQKGPILHFLMSTTLMQIYLKIHLLLYVPYLVFSLYL